MRDLLQIFKEHKIILITIIILLVLFISWSGYQVTKNNAASEKKPGTEQTSPDAQNAQKDTVQLTDAQQKIVNAYSQEEKDFVALLSASAWATENEGSTLRFSGNGYTLSASGQKQTKPFIIDAIIPNTITGEGATYEGFIASASNGEATYIVKLQRWKTVEATSDWELSSLMFSADGNVYQAQAAATAITLNGLNDEVRSMYGGEENLRSAIEKFVIATYPSAHNATWQEKVEIDYKERVIQTNFILDNSSSSNITVVYRMDTQEIEVM